MNECNIQVYATPTGDEMLNPLTLYAGQTVYLQIPSDMLEDNDFLGWKDLYGNVLDESVIHLVDGGRYETTIVCGSGYVASFKTKEENICLVTVTCNPNEGTVSRSSEGYDTCGATINISASPACCYDFSTWNDSASDRTQANRTVTVQGIQTYTATFTPHTFPISVCCNDSTLGTVSVDKNAVQCGDTFTITATPNEGCSFHSWKYGGEEISYNAKEEIELVCEDYVDGDCYYAYFTMDPKYTLTYNYNYEGCPAPIVDTFSDGENFIYRTASATNLLFCGWSTSDSASCDDPDLIHGGDSGTFDFGENVVLYGVWKEAEKYSCRYYGKPDDASYQYGVTQLNYPGETFTLLTPPSIAGYVFQGWKICPQGETPSPNADVVTGTYTMITGGLDAHAVWTQESQTTYSLTYIHNNGTGQQTVINGISAGTNVTVKWPGELGILYPYHTFQYWAPGNYTGGSTLTFGNSDISLTAVWSARSVTLTYDITDPDVIGTAPSPQTVYEGQSVTLADSSTFSKAGYTFMGWTASYGSSTTLNSPITLNNDMTVYPVWQKASKYTVTYNSSSCPVTDSNQYNSGATVTVKTCNCVKESGCACDGWTDQSGNVWRNGSTFSIYQNMTMVPYFDCCEVKIDTTNRDAELLLNGARSEWGRTYNIEDGMSFDVVPPKACCFEGWIFGDKGEFIQPCEHPIDYEYKLIPSAYARFIDQSAVTPLTDNNFVNELSRPTPYRFIYNRETGEMRQYVGVCDKEEYDFGKLCDGTAIAVITCEQFIETNKVVARFDPAPGNYQSIYDFLEREQWRPSINVAMIRINGVEHYYEYLDCEGNPMFEER